MNRLSAIVFGAAIVLIGCNRQPTNQVQTPTPPTNAITATPINVMDQERGKPTSVQVSDLLKSQVIKIVEEGTKLDQLVAQGVGVMEIRSQLAATKAPLEIAKLAWPDGLTTNALSEFEGAIRAWDFAIDLNERVQKWRERLMEAKEAGVSDRRWAFEVAWAEVEAAANDFPEERQQYRNGYEELVTLAKEGEHQLVYATYPDDFLLEWCCGKRYLPPKENAQVLLGIASNRFKSGREEALKILK